MTVVDTSFVTQMDFTIHTVVGLAPKVSTVWGRAGGGVSGRRRLLTLLAIVLFLIIIVSFDN